MNYDTGKAHTQIPMNKFTGASFGGIVWIWICAGLDSLDHYDDDGII